MREGLARNAQSCDWGRQWEGGLSAGSYVGGTDRVCEREGREKKGCFLPGQLGLQEERTEEGDRAMGSGRGEMVLALGI